MRDFEKYAKKHIGIRTSVVDDYVKLQKMGSMTPNIAEERKLNVAIVDVFSRLMLDRIIFLGTAINSDVSSMINAQLLYLESVDPKEDISIYINSPGGNVYDGLSIYDTMQIVSPKIKTLNMGLSASMASLLLAGGEKGMRYSLKHSRVMIHQPWGGIEGQASDIEITSREIQKLKKELYDVIVNHSKMNMAEVIKSADRDCWLTAIEAKKLGLIDQVLTKTTKR